MSCYVALGVALLSLFAIGLSGLAATAPIRVVVTAASYLMTDTATLAGAKKNVLTRAKRKAVEQVGISIEVSRSERSRVSRVASENRPSIKLHDAVRYVPPVQLREQPFIDFCTH